MMAKRRKKMIEVLKTKIINVSLARKKIKKKKLKRRKTAKTIKKGGLLN